MKLLSLLLASALMAVPVTGLSAETAPARIYQVGTIAPSRYTVIDRLWVARWRTAFDVPSHADAAAATRELLEEATRAGGDGVVNLYCLAHETGAGHYCYGNVIKLK